METPLFLNSGMGAPLFLNRGMETPLFLNSGMQTPLFLNRGMDSLWCLNSGMEAPLISNRHAHKAGVKVFNQTLSQNNVVQCFHDCITHRSPMCGQILMIFYIDGSKAHEATTTSRLSGLQ
jgi:hypothetical protein